jgi:hypothetical protein
MRRRVKLVPEMEGRTAHWYARTRATPSQLAAWRRDAADLAIALSEGTAVLEIAPGPGCANTPDEVRELVATSNFRTCCLWYERVGFEVRLEKQRGDGSNWVPAHAEE